MPGGRKKGCFNPTKHGHARVGSRTRTYAVWKTMRQRCSNPNTQQASDYLLRGIRVCERWNDYANFLADMGEAPPGLSIDRIDNDGNYEPGNCRWATRTEQNRNARRNRQITAFGKTLLITDWERETGINRATIFTRLRYGWDTERALSERPHKWSDPSISYR